jgi:hypothetical protein
MLPGPTCSTISALPPENGQQEASLPLNHLAAKQVFGYILAGLGGCGSSRQFSRMARFLQPNSAEDADKVMPSSQDRGHA